jgi:hypothetical protein
MSTRVFPKGFLRAANRDFAILELLWFGPIFKLEDQHAAAREQVHASVAIPRDRNTNKNAARNWAAF